MPLTRSHRRIHCHRNQLSGVCSWIVVCFWPKGHWPVVRWWRRHLGSGPKAPHLQWSAATRCVRRCHTAFRAATQKRMPLSSGRAATALRDCGWSGPPPPALPTPRGCVGPTCSKTPISRGGLTSGVCLPGRRFFIGWCCKICTTSACCQRPCKAICACPRMPRRAPLRVTCALPGAVTRPARGGASMKPGVA